MWEVSGDKERLQYWPQVLLTIAALLSHIAWVAQPWVTEGRKALSLQAGFHKGILSPTNSNRPRHLVILLSYVHLLPLFFRLLAQVHFLIDGSVEGQSITLRNDSHPLEVCYDLSKNRSFFSRLENTTLDLSIFEILPERSCNITNKVWGIFSVTTYLIFISWYELDISRSRLCLIVYSNLLRGASKTNDNYYQKRFYWLLEYRCPIKWDPLALA